MKDSPDISTSLPLTLPSDGGRRIFDASQPQAIRERSQRDSTLAESPFSETTFDPEKLSREFEVDVRHGVTAAEDAVEKFKPEDRFWLESPSLTDQLQDIYETAKRVEMRDQCASCVQRHLASDKYPPESLLLITERLSSDARTAVEDNKRLFGYKLGQLFPKLFYDAQNIEALQKVFLRFQRIPEDCFDPQELRRLRETLQFVAADCVVKGWGQRIRSLDPFDIDKSIDGLGKTGLFLESPKGLFDSWRGKDSFISSTLFLSLCNAIESIQPQEFLEKIPRVSSSLSVLQQSGFLDVEKVERQLIRKWTLNCFRKEAT